jgi:hypothetical protein
MTSEIALEHTDGRREWGHTLFCILSPIVEHCMKYGSDESRPLFNLIYGLKGFHVLAIS